MPSLTSQHLTALKKYRDKQALTLEEIKLFPQSPESLDFEGLTADQLIELAELAGKITSVKRVKLASSNVSLKDATCQALADMLKYNSNITSFQLQADTLSARNVGCLADAIANARLVDFTFELRRTYDGFENLIVLLNALAKLRTLKHLQLTLKIIADMGKSIAGILTSNNDLESLQMSGEIEWDAIEEIAKNMVTNQSLKSLAITNNNLGFAETDCLLNGFINNQSLLSVQITPREETREKPVVKSTLSFIQERNAEFQAILKLIKEKNYRTAEAKIADFENHLSLYVAQTLALEVTEDPRVVNAHAQMVKSLKEALVKAYKSYKEEQYQLALNLLRENNFAGALDAIKRFEEATKKYLAEFKDLKLREQARQEQDKQVQLLKQTFEYNLLVCEKIAGHNIVNLKDWKGIYLSDFIAVIKKIAEEEKDQKRQGLLDKLSKAILMPAFLNVWCGLRNDALVQQALQKRFGTDRVMVYELLLACPQAPAQIFPADFNLEQAERKYRTDMLDKNTSTKNPTDQKPILKKEDVTPQENTWPERIQALAKIATTAASANSSSMGSPASSASNPATQNGAKQATAVSSAKSQNPSIKKSTAMPAWLFWSLVVGGALLGAALLLTGIGALLEFNLVFSLAALLSLNTTLIPTLAIVATALGSVLLASNFLLGAFRIFNSKEIQAVLEPPPADKAAKPVAKSSNDSLFNCLPNPANLFKHYFKTAPSSTSVKQSASNVAQLSL